MTTTTFLRNARSRAFANGEWTEEAYLALESDERVELLDGSLYVFPRPLIVHQGLSGQLLIAMFNAVQAQGLDIYQGVCLRLRPQRIVCPDLVILEADNSDERVLDVTLVRLVCEITSPSNAQHDRVRKMRYYAEAGIDWYLLVEPRPELLIRLLRLDGDHYVVHREAKSGQTLRLDDPIQVLLDPAKLAPRQRSASSRSGRARLTP